LTALSAIYKRVFTAIHNAPIPDASPHRHAASAPGVRPSFPRDQVALANRLIGEGRSISAVAKILKVNRATLYLAIAPAGQASCRAPG
jgi:hypothetical protein